MMLHKEQDRGTTFGWNPMGETSSCLEGFSGNLWIRISQCSTEFLVTVCKVAKFRWVTFCRKNCSFRQVDGLPEIFLKVWTKTVYPKVPTLHQ
jgi:hypothetical protein